MRSRPDASRVATVVATFLGGLALVLPAIPASTWRSAVATGEDLYVHRPLVLGPLTSRTAPRATVVWLGDSTIIARPGETTYPSLTAVRALRPRGASSWSLASAGLDLFAYYELMGPVLALGPRVVVVVANLRLMGARPSFGRGFNDLAGMIPTGELPHALALPFGFRGMSAPALFGARALRATWAERTFLGFEGLRRNTLDTVLTWVPAAAEAERMIVERQRAEGRLFQRRAYDSPLTPTTPLVRFAAAAVRLATTRGVGVLVVVAPVPWVDLERDGLYEQGRYEAKVGVLRDAVEAAGGRLLDLHRVIGPLGFADELGHLTPLGHEHVADVVTPALVALCDAAQPAAR